MKKSEFNYDNFKTELNKTEVSFEKEMNELRSMIKEVIGEDNKQFYRIGLITELIEKDVKEIIQKFAEVSTSFGILNSALEKVNELHDSVKKETGLTINDEKIDPVSRIVKDLNSLDDFSKKHLMYYVAGYTSASKKNLNI